MANHLGSFFRTARLERGLSLEQLAGTLGYRNARKTARRIGRFECDGIIKEELLARLAEALGIGWETVEGLLGEER
jgi:transcriptional regulator with XRE-family HTH domain